MGRKAKLDPTQIDHIHSEYASGVKVKALAEQYGVSTLLIYRVLSKKGAYEVKPQMIGQPILDAHGNVVNVVPAQVTSEG